MNAYSAGAVKYPFWFYEFKQTLEWHVEGTEWDEIHQRIVDQNCFKSSSVIRAKGLYGEISRRVQSLAEPICELFGRIDDDNQRVINIIALMNTNSLFKAFMTRVYRNEVLLGGSMLRDYEIQAFFRQIQTEDDVAARWHGETLQRLAGSFKNYLTAAKLAQKSGVDLVIIKPLLDIALERALIENGQQSYVAVLTGRQR